MEENNNGIKDLGRYGNQETGSNFYVSVLQAANPAVISKLFVGALPGIFNVECSAGKKKAYKKAVYLINKKLFYETDLPACHSDFISIVL